MSRRRRKSGSSAGGNVALHYVGTWDASPEALLEAERSAVDVLLGNVGRNRWSPISLVHRKASELTSPTRHVPFLAGLTDEERTSLQRWCRENPDCYVVVAMCQVRGPARR